MVNKEIIAIKDSILSTVGDDCEKIFLFGSYANGNPDKNSDYDFYVVLKDGLENPLLITQKIYEYMCDTNYTPVDVIANYKSNFEKRRVQPTIERAVFEKGVLLYERV
jgi:predicted nucleotidyltransferase